MKKFMLLLVVTFLSVSLFADTKVRELTTIPVAIAGDWYSDFMMFYDENNVMTDTKEFDTSNLTFSFRDGYFIINNQLHKIENIEMHLDPSNNQVWYVFNVPSFSKSLIESTFHRNFFYVRIYNDNGLGYIMVQCTRKP